MFFMLFDDVGRTFFVFIVRIFFDGFNMTGVEGIFGELLLSLLLLVGGVPGFGVIFVGGGIASIGVGETGGATVPVPPGEIFIFPGIVPFLEFKSLILPSVEFFDSENFGSGSISVIGGLIFP